MFSKERVHLALKRQPVDRIPIFMWYHPITAKQLGRLLEIPADRVSEVMGDDVKQTWVANNHAMEGIVHEHEGEGHVDDWGIEWVKIDEFNQIVHSPLENATQAEILAYLFPYDKIEQLLANMNKVVPYSEKHFHCQYPDHESS